MESVLAACPTLAAVHAQLSGEHRDALQQVVGSYADPATAVRFFQAWDVAAEAGGLSAEACLHRARGFCDTLTAFNASYAGGISSYLVKAQVLLAQSRAQYNPLVEEWEPGVPAGATFGFGAGDPEFERLEEVGAVALRNAAFVLVAGGRGERLGYDGIKVRACVRAYVRVCVRACVRACVRLCCSPSRLCWRACAHSDGTAAHRTIAAAAAATTTSTAATTTTALPPPPPLPRPPPRPLHHKQRARSRFRAGVPPSAAADRRDVLAALCGEHIGLPTAGGCIFLTSVATTTTTTTTTAAAAGSNRSRRRGWHCCYSSRRLRRGRRTCLCWCRRCCCDDSAGDHDLRGHARRHGAAAGGPRLLRGRTRAGDGHAAGSRAQPPRRRRHARHRGRRPLHAADEASRCVCVCVCVCAHAARMLL